MNNIDFLPINIREDNTYWGSESLSMNLNFNTIRDFLDYIRRTTFLAQTNTAFINNISELDGYTIPGSYSVSLNRGVSGELPSLNGAYDFTLNVFKANNQGNTIIQQQIFNHQVYQRVVPEDQWERNTFSDIERKIIDKLVQRVDINNTSGSFLKNPNSAYKLGLLNDGKPVYIYNDSSNNQVVEELATKGWVNKILEEGGITPGPNGFATVKYVDDKIASLVNSSPEALDTLKELADALGNDPNFATTVLNKIAAIENLWKIDDKGRLYSDMVVYSTKSISAKGVALGGGGSGGGINETLLWSLLGDGDNPDKQIALSHLSKVQTWATSSFVNQSMLAGYATQSWVQSQGYLTSNSLTNYVVKEPGKGLSTNDFTDTYKSKLDSLSSYVLPPATSSRLGGIMVGNGLVADASGILSINLSEGNLPAISISKVTGLQTSLNSKLDASIFNDLFEKINIGTVSTPKYIIRAKYGMSTNFTLSAKGIAQSGGSGGGGINEQLLWTILANEGTEQIAKNHLTTALSGYVTVDTPQTIQGQKTFTSPLFLNHSVIGDGVDNISLYTKGFGGQGLNIRSLLVSADYSYRQYVPDQGAYFVGDVKASSFVKHGGLSSQFLKADGSIDGNAYVTINHNHSYLLTEDYRDRNPLDFPNKTFTPFFLYGGKIGINGYCDAMYLNTYSDVSGGKTNLLIVSKVTGSMYRMMVDQGSAAWNGTLVEMLDTNNWRSIIDGRYLPLTGGALSGNLTVGGIVLDYNNNYLRTDGWFQNNISGYGLYNSAENARWIAQGGAWHADKPIFCNIPTGGYFLVQRAGVNIGAVGQGSSTDDSFNIVNYKSDKVLSLKHNGILSYDGLVEVRELDAIGGRGLVMYSGSNTSLGMVEGTTSIRSGLTDLYHFRSNTNYKIWDEFNDGAGSGLDADLLDGLHLKEISKYNVYSYTQGCLVYTNISAASNAMCSARIKGNSYGGNAPIDTSIEFYNYVPENQIIGYSGLHKGYNFGNIHVFIFNGEICLWFKQGGNFQSFEVELTFTNDGTNISKNRVTYIENTVKPSGAQREVVIQPVQSAFTTSNVASATKWKNPISIWGQTLDGTGNVDGNFSTSGDIYSHGIIKTQVMQLKGQDLVINGRRAIVGDPSKLYINFGVDFLSTELLGPFFVNGNLDVAGNSHFNQKVIVDRNRYSQTASPTISLAIGDTDTGFDWVSDGAFKVKSNGVDVATINPYGIAANKRIYTTEYLQADSHVRAGRIFAGFDAGVPNSMSCSDWFRSSGPTGWFNQTYSGGIYMEDPNWVRVYNSKKFLVSNTEVDSIRTSGGIFADNMIKSESGRLDLGMASFQYDPVKKMVKLILSDGTPCGFAATGQLAAKGVAPATSRGLNDTQVYNEVFSLREDSNTLRSQIANLNAEIILLKNKVTELTNKLPS